MRRSLLFLLFLAAGRALAQPAPDLQVLSPGSEKPGARHFCWRVRSATATVYLLGSIHLRPASPLVLPEAVEKAFESSGYVGFEYDLAQNDRIQKDMAAYIQAHFTYPEGDSLERHLSPAQWKTVRAALEADGFPVKRALRLKPVILAMTLDVLAYQRKGLQADKGIDEIFLRKSLAAGKPTFGMEYWWEPLKAFEELTDREQARFLLADLRDTERETDDLDRILRLWEAGDGPGMDALVHSDTGPDEKPLLDKLLKDRNAHWMLQMERMLRAQGTYFVVVGSAHLVGPLGLPRWLKFKGYEVEQM